MTQGSNTAAPILHPTPSPTTIGPLSEEEAIIILAVRDLPDQFTGFLTLKWTDGELVHLSQEVNVRRGRR
jgi:hypothetical protein